jgi:hypothetical protein
MFFSSVTYVMLLAVASALWLMGCLPVATGITFTDCPFHHLQHLESSITSQSSGIDGVIMAILSVVGAPDKAYLEVTPEDFRKLDMLKDIFGFNSLINDNKVWREASSLDNIGQLLAEHRVPTAFDVLSVQYGFSTWWVLASILKAEQYYRPRVIMAEVNSMLGFRDEVSVNYDFV